MHRGIWGGLAVLFFLGLLFQAYLLSAFAVMVALVGGVALWWNKHSLDEVIYQRKLFYRRSFPGETIPLQIIVENRKLLPLTWLRARDTVPYSVAPHEEDVLRPTHDQKVGALIHLFSLRWFERSRRAYDLLLRKRGVYALGPARLESGDLFGWFENRKELAYLDLLTVFPAPVPFSELPLPADDPFGERRARRRLYEDPNLPMGVRAYHPEDDFRRVHWPATARTGDLQVKVYQPVSAQVLVVCLNVSTFAHYWEGVDTELLEYLVSVAASVVHRSMDDGYRVGLVSNGALAHADQPFRVPPGRSPRQLPHLLDTLAGVTPHVTSPIERVLLTETTRLPLGARLMVITGVDTPELSSALLRLHRHGREITLLSFAPQTPPYIPGIRIYHKPFERGYERSV